MRVSQTENLYYNKDTSVDDLFPNNPKLVGTSFPLPTAPGLGIDFNEALAQGQTFKFWEAPHWKRRDGSVTNW